MHDAISQDMAIKKLSENNPLLIKRQAHHYKINRISNFVVKKIVFTIIYKHKQNKNYFSTLSRNMHIEKQYQTSLNVGGTDNLTSKTRTEKQNIGSRYVVDLIFV